MENLDDQACLSKGSQECFETVCEPCSEGDNIHVKAEGYCITCKEFMCKQCIQSHKRMKLLKDHKIQGPDEMPKTKPSHEAKENIILPQEELNIACKEHEGEIIRYFCKRHNVVGCVDCITLAHRSCANIKRVVEASSDASVATELEEFDQRLNKVAEGIRNLVIMAEKNLLQVEDQREKLLQSIRKYKETMMETFDNLANEIEIQAKSKINEEQAKIDQLMNRCKSLQENVELSLNEFESLRKCNQKNKEFILIKQIQPQMKEWEKDLTDLEANTKLNQYQFCPDVNFRYALKMNSKLGQILKNDCAELCNDCKEMTAKVHMNELSCGHGICEVCQKGLTTNDYTCSVCGTVSVQCKRCKTAVFKTSISVLACGHNVCLPCREQKTETPCTDCGLLTGNQPPGTIHESTDREYEAPINVLTFNFADGKQESFHPCPAERYRGGRLTFRLRTVFDGNGVYQKLKTAFNRQLICRIHQGKILANIEPYTGEIIINRNIPCNPYNRASTDEYKEYLERLKLKLHHLGITD